MGGKFIRTAKDRREGPAGEEALQRGKHADIHSESTSLSREGPAGEEALQRGKHAE